MHCEPDLDMPFHPMSLSLTILLCTGMLWNSCETMTGTDHHKHS
jgi:hypothetical protein